MTDWVKKIEKSVGGDLQPGETVRAGLFLQPCGTTTKMVSRGVAGLAGAALASRAGTDAGALLDDGHGIGAALPDDRIVIGLTGHRMVVWGHSTLSGKPKGLRSSIPLAEISGVAIEKHRATFTVMFAFCDGSGKVYEAPRLGGDAEGFAAQFSRLAAG